MIMLHLPPFVRAKVLHSTAAQTNPKPRSKGRARPARAEDGPWAQRGHVQREPGDLGDDVPEVSVPWLLEQGFIEAAPVLVVDLGVIDVPGWGDLDRIRKLEPVTIEGFYDSAGSPMPPVAPEEAL